MAEDEDEESNLCTSSLVAVEQVEVAASTRDSQLVESDSLEEESLSFGGRQNG